MAKPTKKVAKKVTKKTVEPKVEAPKEASKDLGDMLSALAKAIKETSHYQHGESIKYPIEVSKVNVLGSMGFSNGITSSMDHGTLVAVRPVNSEKTYLGVYLGNIPLGLSHAYDPKKKEMNLYIKTNPAICIPDLGCRVVMGASSWWRELKNEDELKQITDADIQNVWYVKALTQIKDFQSGPVKTK